MKHELRKLKTNDVFKMSKILKKMNLKIKFEKDTNEKQMGFEMIKSVFENLHLAEKEVNEFLADMTGMTIEEFSDLPFEDGIDIINQFKNMKEIGNFLKSANK